MYNRNNRKFVYNLGDSYCKSCFNKINSLLTENFKDKLFYVKVPLHVQSFCLLACYIAFLAR
jgi:hypothetical protein